MDKIIEWFVLFGEGAIWWEFNRYLTVFKFSWSLKKFQDFHPLKKYSFL